MMMPPKHFVVMAGGTGGHVFPGLEVAKYLIDEGHTVSWLGTRSGIEATLVPENEIDIDFINIAGVRGKGAKGLMLAPFKIMQALFQSFGFLMKRKPKCVIGMGGFVAGPGAIAAKIMNIPVVVHEQNAIPGTTNRILSKLGCTVLQAFPNAFDESVKATYVGNPVRENIKNKDLRGENYPLHVLVVGGSLGAKALNDIMPEVATRLSGKITVWHQCGKRNLADVEAGYAGLDVDVKVADFISDMNAAYHWADLVICRSGAMTVSEVACAGLPAIFIPYPYAIDDHQTANASWLVNEGAARMIQQKDLTVEKLVDMILDFIEDHEALSAMSKKASEIAIYDATEKVSTICMEKSK